MGKEILTNCLIIFSFFWGHRGNLCTFKNIIDLWNFISMQKDLNFKSFDSICIFVRFCFINAASWRNLQSAIGRNGSIIRCQYDSSYNQWSRIITWIRRIDTEQFIVVFGRLIRWVRIQRENPLQPRRILENFTELSKIKDKKQTKRMKNIKLFEWLRPKIY